MPHIKYIRKLDNNNILIIIINLELSTLKKYQEIKLGRIK